MSVYNKIGGGANKVLIDSKPPTEKLNLTKETIIYKPPGYIIEGGNSNDHVKSNQIALLDKNTVVYLMLAHNNDYGLIKKYFKPTDIREIYRKGSFYSSDLQSGFKNNFFDSGSAGVYMTKFENDELSPLTLILKETNTPFKYCITRNGNIMYVVTKNEIYKYDLETNSKTLILTTNTQTANIKQIFEYNNNLYYSYIENNLASLFKFDLEKNTTTKLFDINDSTLKWRLDSTSLKSNGEISFILNSGSSPLSIKRKVWNINTNTFTEGVGEHRELRTYGGHAVNHIEADDFTFYSYNKEGAYVGEHVVETVYKNYYKNLIKKE